MDPWLIFGLCCFALAFLIVLGAAVWSNVQHNRKEREKRKE